MKEVRKKNHPSYHTQFQQFSLSSLVDHSVEISRIDNSVNTVQ